MQFFTPVEITKATEKITHGTRLLMMGSCFAENIGKKILDAKFDVCINPFGILYNPASIAVAMERISQRCLFDGESKEVFFHQERWHSTLHHGDFSCSSKHETIERINSVLIAAHERLQRVDTVIITLGTAYIYCDRDGNVVGNCHKLPQSNFTRRRMSVGECVEALERIKSTLPSKARIIFTVSPIRHLRDGAHDNQISKSTLLLAVDEMCSRYERCEYFPAYEIMLDELRDYRFYNAEMTHPSPQAVEYIWERFTTCYFGDESKAICKRIEQISKALEHRPINPCSDAHKAFIKSILQKIEQIVAELPDIKFEKEIEQCNIQLKR